MQYSVPNTIGSGFLPFVGRQSETDALLSAHLEAYEGDRIAVLVTAQIGVGKTRFLDEFRSNDGLRRSLGVHIRLHSDDTIDSQAILFNAIRETLDARPILRLQIERLFEKDRTITVNDLLNILNWLVRRMLVVLTIDDIDANPDFLPGISALLRRIEGPFFIAATSSTDIFEEFEQTLLSCQTTVYHQKLRPFTEADIRNLMQKMFGAVPNDRNTTLMLEATNGIPVVCGEYVQALTRSGCVVLHEDSWMYARSFERCEFQILHALPALKLRFNGLLDHERDAVAVAGLIGSRIPVQTLIDLGFSEGWHWPLITRELLVSHGNYVEFPHRVLLDIAFELACAQDLQKRFGPLLLNHALMKHSENELNLSKRTLQLIISEFPEHQRLSTLQDILSCACRLEEQGALNAALQYFQVCRFWWIELMTRCTRQEYFDAYIRFVNVLYRLGRIREYGALLNECIEAIADDSITEDQLHQVVKLFWSLIEFESSNNDGKVIRLVRRAFAILEHFPAHPQYHQCRSMITQVHAIALDAVGKSEEALNVMYEMLERWDRRTPDNNIANALLLILQIQTTDDRKDILTEYISAVIEIYSKQGNTLVVEQFKLQLLKLRLDELGNVDAERESRSMIHVFKELDMPRSAGQAWSLLATVQSRSGNYAAAVESLDNAIQIGEQLNLVRGLHDVFAKKAKNLILLKRDEQAEKTLAELQQYSPPVQLERTFVEVLLAVRRGELNFNEAKSRLEEYDALAAQRGFLPHQRSRMSLELEGYIMLSASITSAQASNYVKRVSQLGDNPAAHGMLWILGLCTIGRTLKPSKTASVSGTEHKQETLVISTLSTVKSVLSYWSEHKAPGLIRHAFRLMHEYLPTSVSLPTTENLDLRKQVGDGETEQIRYRIMVFGRLRVTDADGLELGGRMFGTQKADSRARKFLAALVCSSVYDIGLSRERIIDMVWGEHVSSDTASNNFHVTLAGLRQVIAEGIEFDGQFYRLNTRIVQIDVLRFMQLCNQATRADALATGYHGYDLYNAACNLCNREFLESMYDQWVEDARDFLSGKIRFARIRLAELAFERGDHDIVRIVVRVMLERDAADELAIGLRLRMLQVESERSKAIREYNEFVRILRDEYGVEPSHQLRKIRDHLQQE